MSDVQHTQEPEPSPARNGERRSKRKKQADPPPPAEQEVSEREADRSEAEPEQEEQLLPIGNSIRWRGVIPLVIGAFVAFCLMAVAPQYRFGVPIAAAAIFVASFGLLDLVGSFDDPEDRVAGRVTLAQLARPLGIFLAGGFSLWGLICLAVDGRLSASFPVLTAGVLVPASFLITVVGAYQVGLTFGVFVEADGSVRPLHKRHGFWLVVLTTLLYLPLLGSHSLSDPWETHYGEVAREILARNDWISTWWAQDGWFWSKPVLDLWIQALGMAVFGVHWQSDQVLHAVREGRVPWPEWAVRMPVFLLTIVAVFLLYKAVARVFGRRAGLLGGVVLLTMPQWFLLANQTMTDMPFVAPMASAMALLLLGAHEDPEEEVRVYELRLGYFVLRFSAYHLVFGAIAMCAVPQILYLLSRNVLLDMRGFHTHLDAFSSGSPGNCGLLPGNEACRAAQPVVRGLHPALQALIWAQALSLVFYLNWGERRRQRLYFIAAWFFAALSTMGKGPAGFILPVGGLIAYVVASGRWREEGRGAPLGLLWRLRLLLRVEGVSGVLILLCVAMPWFVAMYVRHGQPFTDRLLFHDMFKRAFTHVHDTNEGDDVSFRFYIWQLGYATFPWTGLVPAGLVWWLRRREDDERKGDASVFFLMWFLLAFTLFSLMLTKFHHYILPAVPPAAMLTGVLLDDLLTRALPEVGVVREKRSPIDVALYALGLTGGVVATLWGAARVVKHYTALPMHAPSQIPGLVLLVGGILILGGVVSALGPSVVAASADGDALASLREPGIQESDPFRVRYERIILGAAGIAGAMLVLAVGRDLSQSFEGMYSQIRLMHLITYNYRRPWPTSLDFGPTLWAFTAAAAVLTFAIASARWRRHVVGAIVALGIVFGVWGLDVYFMKISPHWGQRETTVAYYQAARETPGPLIAYQMNWKGENFYTGNHVPAFVSSGKKFQDYILEEKKKGLRTFYFVTEHGRTGTLSNELGPTREFEKLTTPELDNKFVLVRARFD